MAQFSCLCIMSIALQALLLPLFVQASNDVTKTDQFLFPPEPPTEGTYNYAIYHEQDVFALSWETSVGNTTLEYQCCTPTVCTVLRAIPDITGIKAGSWVFNLTLSFGTGKDCFLRMSQPLRGPNQGFESAHFIVQEAGSGRKFWGTSGSQEVEASQALVANIPSSEAAATPDVIAINGSSAPNGNAINGIFAPNGEILPTGEGAATHITSLSALSPPLPLPADSSTQFPQECLAVVNTSTYKGSCWAALDLSTWIPLWVETFVPCAANASCLIPSGSAPPWTYQFLISAGAGPERDCWLEGSGVCNVDYHPPKASSGVEDDVLFARYSYVTYTIYAVWLFFDSWQSTMNYVVGDVENNIDSITLISDSDQSASHNWAEEIVTTILGAVLAAIDIPDLGEDVSEIFKLIYKVAATGITSQGSTVLGYVWPTSVDPQQKIPYQNAELHNLIGAAHGTLNANINTTLGIIQGVEDTNATDDYTDFLQFVQSGAFSDNGPGQVSLNGQDNATLTSLYQNFNTYLITEALAQNGYYAVLIPGLNPEQVYQSTAFCPAWAGSDCNSKSKDVGCEGKLDQYGLCRNIWFSATQNSSYVLLKSGKTNIAQSTDVLTKIFQGGYATGQTIFEGAGVCALRNLFPASSSVSYQPNIMGMAAMMFLTGSMPALTPYEVPYNQTHSLVAIDGNAFVELSKRPLLAPLFVHPNDTYFNFDQSGHLDLSCISQLNSSVANFWAGEKADSWTQNRPH